MRRLTGLPCPACGLTHAFCALCRGRVVDAWHLNPFALVFFAAAITLVVAPAVERLPFALARDWRLAAPPAWTVVALVAAMWVWDVLRIAGRA